MLNVFIFMCLLLLFYVYISVNVKLLLYLKKSIGTTNWGEGEFPPHFFISGK